ncbi:MULTISPECIES: ABC transporter permease subunit [unclassified Streptomyces]|uniref:ABC transporter permease subunit n=1 Tax=unclassified Streptomyces TaxID=2593676 RepID=UPI002E810EDC|nr:ABC transporter permease subunit [Streptomyces sp. NBC_00589]WTI38139.1 hypothetical protein OIC96_25695 [Streptomyces sp. NBC_00775]WUB28182.1 hypothetical protein OHA51_24040 [Streptomyces sp. NBC_00589]
MTALATAGPATRPQRAVLRLHRPALIVWGAFLLLAIGDLLWLHLFRAPAERTSMACDFEITDCSGGPGYQAFTDVNNVMNFTGEVVSRVSIVVAAWAGAALIGRELETGTARLAWTQGVSPARWLTAKLTGAALPLTAGTTLLTLVFAWVWTADQDVLVANWSYARFLVSDGPLAVALVLTALAVGALAGVAIGRALPALAVAAVAAYALRWFFGDKWDNIWPARHYWPVQITSTVLLLLIAALATVLTFRLLARRTESRS